MSNIVFLHGYGANKEDLMPLSSYLQSSPEQNFHFIDAPLELPMMAGARAWFSITTQHFNSLAQGDSTKKFEQFIPEELDSSLDHIALELSKRPGFNEADDFYLAGFSQGSMCALHFYRKFYHRFNFKGMALLSSHLVGKGLLEQAYSKLPQIPIFQSHGNQDQILKVAQGHCVRDFLAENGFKVDYQEFNGGHEIPLAVIEKLKAFLS